PLGDGEFQYCAVLQGRSFDEIRDHYTYLTSGDIPITTIGIPFGLEFGAYGETQDTNPLLKYMGGFRFSHILRLVDEGVWNTKFQHHLFGLYNPGELCTYRLFGDEVFNSIRSNDSRICYTFGRFGADFSIDVGTMAGDLRAQNPRYAETFFDQSPFIDMEQEKKYSRNASITKRFAYGEPGIGTTIKQIYKERWGMKINEVMYKIQKAAP
ncbi:MAG: hypothetical protein ACREHG_03400, partial [Candidatus Saccharimonadales bacterium]